MNKCNFGKEISEEEKSEIREFNNGRIVASYLIGVALFITGIMSTNRILEIIVNEGNERLLAYVKIGLMTMYIIGAGFVGLIVYLLSNLVKPFELKMNESIVKRNKHYFVVENNKEYSLNSKVRIEKKRGRFVVFPSDGDYFDRDELGVMRKELLRLDCESIKGSE